MKDHYGPGDTISASPLQELRQHGINDLCGALKRVESRILFLSVEPPDQQTINDLHDLRLLRHWLKELQPLPSD